MPPRKGIVKSGNAGNSSKSSAPAPTANASSDPPPLFPPGSKWPLSLLSERCQKLGWEKPTVETRSRGKDGFSFSVILSRHNKKTSEKDTVRMEPHPPYCRPTAIEARHWGATYALYRFSNGIQLNRVLPPGPRDYWNELAVEHKAAPEHQKWMYDADPFAAQKAVEERQKKAAEKRAEVSNPKPIDNTNQRSGTHPTSNYDVIMATTLREFVETAIKKGIALYPEVDDSGPLMLSSDGVPEISRNLGLLGFTKSQIQDATTFLCQESALTSSLLSSLPPLQSCIEYLILHVPECDLPQRFLPSHNSSNPFISSAHSGNDDLKTRWIEEKAVKEAGWPAKAVKKCLKDRKLVENWGLLIVELGYLLIGQKRPSNTGDDSLYEIDETEYEALGGHLIEPGHLVLPLFSAPIQVHILFSEKDRYPRHGYIPLYLTSTTVPGYIRLHLLSRCLSQMITDAELESGSFCMTVLQSIEGEWANVEDNGPPDISSVMRHILPQPSHTAASDMDIVESAVSVPLQHSRYEGKRSSRDDRSDEQVLKDFSVLQQNAKYEALIEARSRLPAFKAKAEFLQILEKHRAVVVVGETGEKSLIYENSCSHYLFRKGCGKTTQLPQLILDALIMSNQGSTASIIVTQPRRLSAISVAARVSQERLDDGSVGYAIRGETKVSKRTKLLFCTTGVVLRRLSDGDGLRDVTHVIVDEVHERSLDGDILLLELKELLRTHSKLKVILMSATINHEVFIKYFNNAPLLSIPGFAHPVTDKYLEDIFASISYRPPVARGGKRDKSNNLPTKEDYLADGVDESVAKAVADLALSERIDFQLVAELTKHIMDTQSPGNGILIFLPGVNEIRQCIDSLKRFTQGYNNVQILPLHANLSNDEQRRIFEPTKGWKVIAATNVAETSITIDDVTYVIDVGRVKENRYDAEKNLSGLVETWVTQAAAKQRRGRAGRTKPGVCYKLYTKRQQQQMIKYPVPEIHRVPLESVCLSVKAAKQDEDVKSFLSRAIDPPPLPAIDQALLMLEEVGALDDSGRLTALGRHISLMPTDIRLAKMLVLATILQCLGPILTVVALLSSKPLFVSPMDKRDEANAARERFATGDSDLLTDVNAFDECMKMHSEEKSNSAIRAFCEENFISQTTLGEVSTLRHDFLSHLEELGFVPRKASPDTPSLNVNSKNLNLVKAAMLGGLWPHVARIHLPDVKIKYDKVAAGTVQRQNVAKDFKLFDLKEGRVFLHPGSVLFNTSDWRPPFVCYFQKYMTSKVPAYSVLLFGGPVNVDHIRSALTIGTKNYFIKMSAIPRIGVLVNQLRRLFDAQLQRCIEDGKPLDAQANNPVLQAIMALLMYDGKSE
ncbi:hypothetical protein CVT24_008889 [Panaeolus cyanescens]|uniref:P-loop containing nucleoside triphosphate hydrolase protein n=1 Tax=Panaeolus cyanescens TaxID=181874 RepID=A0A409VAX7_9AGAR|nr:hypothetical protein CVT24_008889 [Panaeolus cyanescens]